MCQCVRNITLEHSFTLALYFKVIQILVISSATIYTLISGGLAGNQRNEGVEEEIAGIER